MVNDDISEKLSKMLNENFTNMKEQIQSVEDNLRKDINGIRKDFNNFKLEVDKRFEEVDKKVESIESSQNFISADFEKHKKNLETLSEKEKQLMSDNVQLYKKINSLKTSLEGETIKRNEASQYYRSSFMVEISNLPPNKHGHKEDTMDIVTKIAKLANFEDFDTSQIDVVHRLSSNPNSPVIIMFTKKQYRQNFYFQRSKLKYVHVNQLDDEEFEFDKEARRAANTFFYLKESLTRENRELFMKAKKIAKAKEYEYPAYTVKGEVRVCKNDTTNYVIIQCEEDLKYII